MLSGEGVFVCVCEWVSETQQIYAMSLAVKTSLKQSLHK